MNEHIILMARPPELGRVKTRLAATLGEDIALAIYCQLLNHTFDVLTEVGKSLTVFAAGNPQWFHDLGYNTIEQTDGDLGVRMEHAFASTFHKKSGAVIMLGTDCLELTEQHVKSALDCLTRMDVVLGPAKDGGYYLIGMKSHHRELFEEMPWSTDKLLEQTIKAIRRNSLSFGSISILRDVDIEEDLPERMRRITV